MTKKSNHASNDLVNHQQEVAQRKLKGELNIALKHIYDEHMKLDEEIREINAQKRDIRARAREEHHISSKVFMDVVKRLKMDTDVRTQYELDLQDCLEQIGFSVSYGLSTSKQSDGANKAKEKVAALKG